MTIAYIPLNIGLPLKHRIKLELVSLPTVSGPCYASDGSKYSHSCRPSHCWHSWRALEPCPTMGTEPAREPPARWADSADFRGRKSSRRESAQPTCELLAVDRRTDLQAVRTGTSTVDRSGAYSAYQESPVRPKYRHKPFATASPGSG